MRRFRTGAMALVVVAIALGGLMPAALAKDTGGPVIVDVDRHATPDMIAALRAAGLNVGVAYRNFAAVSGNLPQGRAAEVGGLDFVKGIRADTIRSPSVLSGRESEGGPTVPLDSTWYLDIIDRDKTSARGDGVYVAVLDGGLTPTWRSVLDADRVRVDLGLSFTGANGNTVPYQLENDRNGHGVAVAATVIGYTLLDKSETGQYFPEPATGTQGEYWVPGVAPNATIIPIKVCDNGVYCWDSSIYAALDYVVDLKRGVAADGELDGAPIVVNLSLGGPSSSVAEENIFKAVVAAGVLVVASAGNDGPNRMGWPGAYPVVISVGVGGWRQQFYGSETGLNNQWTFDDVPEDSIEAWFMVWWSAYEFPDRGQELDVVATGRFMLLPYLNGKATPGPDPAPADGIPSVYNYISGTSFSAPTTTGVVALMLSVNGGLSQAQAEAILRSTAMPIPAGSWDAGFPIPHANAWDSSKSLGGAGQQTGWGLVQADGAVAAAMDL